MDQTELIDFVKEINKIYLSTPNNQGSICQCQNVSNLNFFYGDEKFEVRCNCNLGEEKKIIQINNLFLEEKTDISIKKSNINNDYLNQKLISTDKLYNIIFDLFQKNYIYIKNFLKIINESSYSKTYKQLFFNKIVSSYNANLKKNFDCYKI